MSFKCSPVKRCTIYYREEVNGFFASLGYWNIMNPNQFCDPKWFHFHSLIALFGLYMWLIHEVFMKLSHHFSPHLETIRHFFPLVCKVKECSFSLLLSLHYYLLGVHLPSLGKSLRAPSTHEMEILWIIKQKQDQSSFWAWKSKLCKYTKVAIMIKGCKWV